MYIVRNEKRVFRTSSATEAVTMTSQIKNRRGELAEE